MAPDVDAVDVSGIWLRHIPHGCDPLFRPVPAADNRWQRGSVVDALYLAEDDPTLWAEWYRHLAEHGVPPLRQLPRDLWRFALSASVADLSDAERLARVGLVPPAPGRRSWPAFQRIGERLWRDGWPGLLTRSAARPAGRVLCLFVDDVAPTKVEPIPSPTTVIVPPPPPTGMRT